MTSLSILAHHHDRAAALDEKESAWCAAQIRMALALARLNGPWSEQDDVKLSQAMNAQAAASLIGCRNLGQLGINLALKARDAALYAQGQELIELSSAVESGAPEDFVEWGGRVQRALIEGEVPTTLEELFEWTHKPYGWWSRRGTWNGGPEVEQDFVAIGQRFIDWLIASRPAPYTANDLAEISGLAATFELESALTANITHNIERWQGALNRQTLESHWGKNETRNRLKYDGALIAAHAAINGRHELFEHLPQWLGPGAIRTLHERGVITLKKLPEWVPEELIEANQQPTTVAIRSLLSRHSEKNQPNWHHLVLSLRSPESDYEYGLILGSLNGAHLQARPGTDPAELVRAALDIMDLHVKLAATPRGPLKHYSAMNALALAIRHSGDHEGAEQIGKINAVANRTGTQRRVGIQHRRASDAEAMAEVAQRIKDLRRARGIEAVNWAGEESVA